MKKTQKYFSLSSQNPRDKKVFALMMRYKKLTAPDSGLTTCIKAFLVKHLTKEMESK